MIWRHRTPYGTVRVLLAWLFSLCLCAAILYQLRNDQEKLFRILYISPLYLFFLSALRASIFIPPGISRKLMAERLGIRLAFVDWYGLLIVTNLISLAIPARGDLALSALYLRKKYSLPITHFISMLYGSTILLILCLSITGIFCMALIAAEGVTLDNRILGIVATFGVLSLFLGGLPPSLFRGENWIMRKLRAALEGWIHLRSDKTLLTKLTFLTLSGIVLISLWMYASYRMLGFEISVLSATVTGVIFQMSFIISITPGNLGLREALLGFTSQILGLGFAEGVAVALLQRAVSILVILCLGGIFSAFVMRSLTSIVNSKVSEEKSADEQALQP